MHYYIDGYNMFFRMGYDSQWLQSQRDEFIRDLNEKVSALGLSVSVVFDSAYQAGERERRHYKNLEILFSSERETADEYILNLLSHLSDPQNSVVVTSDKQLASLSRLSYAQVQSIDVFLHWLNRIYQSKQRKTSLKSPSLKAPKVEKSPNLLPLVSTRIEAEEAYFLRIFEQEWEKIQSEEEKVKESLRSLVKHQSPVKKPRPARKSAFTEPAEREVDAVNDMERWLKIFSHKDEKNGE